MAERAASSPGEVSPDAGELVARYSQSTGQTMRQAMDALLYSGGNVGIEVKSVMHSVQVVPGHGATAASSGPLKSKVMLLLSHPNLDDLRCHRYLSGPSGQELAEACEKANIQPDNWYVTAAIKFGYPGARTSPLAPWFEWCRPLLLRELAVVKPDVILACGRVPLTMLFGNKVKITEVKGSILDFNGIPTMPLNSPTSVVLDPTTKPEFQHDIERAAKLIRGDQRVDCAPTNVRLIRDTGELWAWASEMMSRKIFAVDCEWGGRAPGMPDAGLRTVQVCHEPGQVAVLHLRTHRDGNTGMQEVLPEVDAAEALRQVLCRDDVHIIGHFFRADLRWLRAMGVDCLPAFQRGMDTILMHHALFPNDEQQLELVANKLIGGDRYDLVLNTWKSSHQALIKRYGYAVIPDDILIPYGARDTDKTMQIALILSAAMNRPANASLQRLVNTVTHPAAAGILEMEESGFRVDMERYEYLEKMYKSKYEELVRQVRDCLNWPDFNIDSSQQRNEILFGEKYNGKKDVLGNPVRLRPLHVDSLNLTPVKTTGKSAKLWEDVIAEGQEDRETPASDGETLGILAEDNPILGTMRDARYLAKAISNFMPDPVKGPDKQMYYKNGVRAWIEPDGYLRTHISQLAETGRWRSFDYNAQNLPTKREADFQRIFADKNFPPFKSCILGDVDMPIILENDYKSAEVMALGYLAHDANMCQIMTDSKRDIHSEMAVKAFQLPYDPNCGVVLKKWTSGQPSPVAGTVDKIFTDAAGRPVAVGIAGQEIKLWPGLKLAVKEHTTVKAGEVITESFKHLRSAAKTVVFGIPYQRGAKAVAREIQKVGIECTTERAQQIMDAYFDMFKDVCRFLEQCKAAVYDPGYIESVYGRRRFFYQVSDKAAMKAQQREACNWPVQNLVADAINRAVTLFSRYENKHLFRLKLAIHDSVILTCAGADVPFLVEKVIPDCMSRNNIIPKLNFSFGVDTTPYVRWTVKATQEQLEANGWPKGYIVHEE